jgi:hypothetical protein
MTKFRTGVALAALMIAAPGARACEIAGGPYDRALRAEYDQVTREYNAAWAKIFKTNNLLLAQSLRQRADTLEARAAQLRMMQIDAQRGCDGQQ